MTLNNKTIAFIGAGNMAEALIRGLLAAKEVEPEQIIAADVRAERLSFFREMFHIRTAHNNTAAAQAADIILLAVKPQQMGAVLNEIKSNARGRLVVSIAAGISTDNIERGLGGKARVVRAMPNTPALVSAGAAALAKGAYATEEDLSVAEAILGAVGITARVEEKLIDAVTALSGSGPAYVFYVAEAMISAGIEAGLSKELAGKLTIQTILGASKLMVESGESAESLRRKVTSPGGTTEAALKVMNDRKLVEILIEAIKAASRRSKELSGG